MKKLISNYFYTLFYQMLVILTPFITTPYISRILQPTGVGIDAFIMSIVQMFTVFIILSFPFYGSKQIARTNNKIDSSKEFWSIYIIQIIVSIITIAVYLIYLLSVSEYKTLFLIHLCTLLATALDISWFFIGKEQIKKVITRNIFVRLIGIILIFTFVKGADDLYIFILINAITTFVGQLVMWIPLSKSVSLVKVKLVDIKPHLGPIYTLFLPQIMIQVYGNMNKIILGVVSKEIEVGFFNQSYKVIRICYSVFQALSQVMLPRISNDFSNNNIDNIKKYLNFGIQMVLLISFPMAFGLSALAPNFILWFLGPEYIKVTKLLSLMSIIIIFVGLSNVIGVQFLIATDQQKKYSYSVTIGAISSIILNFLLVKKFESIGTSIALISAEAIGAVIQLYFVRNYINYVSFIKYTFKYILLSIPVYYIVSLFGNTSNIPLLVLLILQVLLGSIVYFILLIIFKEPIVKIIYSKLKKTGK